ncbi:MAG: hypothetical protein Q9217_000571 [Psora testacea]
MVKAYNQDNDWLSNHQNRYELTEQGNRTEFWMLTEENLADVDSTLYFPAEASKSGGCLKRNANHGGGNEVDMTQAIQLLSILRPDIEHFWQFEMDARYTATTTNTSRRSSHDPTLSPDAFYGSSSHYFVSAGPGSGKHLLTSSRTLPPTEEYRALSALKALNLLGRSHRSNRHSLTITNGAWAKRQISLQQRPL